MILPYYLRLLCLCLSTFFVAHAVVWLAVRGMSSTAVRIAGTMRPRMASRWLFGLRIAPVAITLFLVIGFCVPSYVWLEPRITGERVGWLCLGLALLGVTVWLLSLVRGLSAMVRTDRYVRRMTRVSAPGEGLVVVEESAAIMAVAGVVHPQLVVSQTVLNALSPEQRDAAFRHEAAHRVSRDNLKRWMFLLSPDVMPFAGGLRRLERAWSTYTEWAADDDAVDGDQDRALSLASALVRVAKLGVHCRPAYLLTSLMDDDRDLEVRVHRLLREPAYAERPLQPLVAMSRNVAIVLAGVAGTMLLWPQSLNGIHRLLEHLVQ